MATTTIECPPSNRMLPGSHALPHVEYPRSVTTLPDDLNPRAVVSQWVHLFNTRVHPQTPNLSRLFLKDSYWRDLLCLTWDFHTLQGPEKIAALLKQHTAGWRIKSLAIDNSTDTGKPKFAPLNFEGRLICVQSFLTIETDVGRGRGLVRLLLDSEDGGTWKAFTLFTALQELKGYEELNRERRPTGTEHGSHLGRKNWKERRVAEENLYGQLEPVVLIVGSGQGGLTAAVRLKQLGVRALVVDRSPRIGDNWRNRYHQLVLHDAVWYDHMPYLSFPPDWPIFTPKDKLAEWFEFYAKVMELNVWSSTTVTASKWDDTSQRWTVTLERDKNGNTETRTLHPRHIVQATGASGEANVPSDIKGLDEFQGDCVVHSSQFMGPQPNAKGKKAVVVGSSNSAHDIAQDFYEHGYHITMVQRSSTYVVTSQTLLDVAMKGLYSEDGPPLEDADLINMSLPSPVLKRFQVDAAQEMTRRDATLLRGLQDAGFALDSGPDGAGLWMKYLQRGGGYYIDVGASQLIADGKIKIKQGQEISHINAHSITFEDGHELEADEIVFATGYGNMRDSARTIFGDDVADRVGDVWGFDKEGETRMMWRRSGHPGFWFFGGNLALCRYYSRLLALQIKALEVGLMKYEDL